MKHGEKDILEKRLKDLEKRVKELENRNCFKSDGDDFSAVLPIRDGKTVKIVSEAQSSEFQQHGG